MRHEVERKKKLSDHAVFKVPMFVYCLLQIYDFLDKKLGFSQGNR